jgi:hypothetical protein
MARNTSPAHEDDLIDTRSDEDGFQSSKNDDDIGNAELDAIERFFLTSKAFEDYKRDLGRFVHPPSARSLRDITLVGDIQLVQQTLEDDFEKVAEGEFEWLRDLSQAGYDTN